MRDALKDIQQKLDIGTYKNEEHVRMSLVARVLLKLGWNIWDPDEVYSEYKTVPHEDASRVDIAMFLTARRPSVFIEVKAVGKIKGSLQETELQLRNYNRDNTALFSIITDGRIWRFYISQTGGKFSEKCFKVIDLSDDELDDIENSLNTFLKKSQIENGEAEREAKKYLKLNEMERLMQELLPQARKLIEEPPYPRLPEALIGLLKQEGYDINVDKAQDFIEKVSIKIYPSYAESLDKTKEQIKTEAKAFIPSVEITTNQRTFNPEEPPNLHFTKIIEAVLSTRHANNWNAFLRCAVELALQRNISIGRLRSLSLPIEEGQKTTDGFCPIPSLNISVQNVDSNRAWLLSLCLAKELQIEIKVRFRWRERDGAAFPGEQGMLHWKPQA